MSLCPEFGCRGPPGPSQRSTHRLLEDRRSGSNREPDVNSCCMEKRREEVQRTCRVTRLLVRHFGGVVGWGCVAVSGGGSGSGERRRRKEKNADMQIAMVVDVEGPLRSRVCFAMKMRKEPPTGTTWSFLQAPLCRPFGPFSPSFRRPKAPSRFRRPKAKPQLPLSITCSFTSSASFVFSRTPFSPTPNKGVGHAPAMPNSHAHTLALGGSQACRWLQHVLDDLSAVPTACSVG